VVEFYLKLKPILRIITYLTYICWEIDNFVIKSDIFRRFVRIFLKNYRVTMTTALDMVIMVITVTIFVTLGRREKLKRQ
jgi:hypothetical protein